MCASFTYQLSKEKDMDNEFFSYSIPEAWNLLPFLSDTAFIFNFQVQS